MKKDTMVRVIADDGQEQTFSCEELGIKSPATEKAFRKAIEKAGYSLSSTTLEAVR